MTFADNQRGCARAKNYYKKNPSSGKHVAKRKALLEEGTRFREYKGFIVNSGFVVFDFYIPSTGKALIEIEDLEKWKEERKEVLRELLNRNPRIMIECL